MKLQPCDKPSRSHIATHRHYLHVIGWKFVYYDRGYYRGWALWAGLGFTGGGAYWIRAYGRQGQRGGRSAWGHGRGGTTRTWKKHKKIANSLYTCLFLCAGVWQSGHSLEGKIYSKAEHYCTSDGKFSFVNEWLMSFTSWIRHFKAIFGY